MRALFTVIISLSVFAFLNVLYFEPLEGLEKTKGLGGRKSPRIIAREMLKKEKPELVLIGDSVTETAYDPELISSLSNLRCKRIHWGGSGPAWWYLVLKNLVARHSKSTRTVVYTFRQRALTDKLNHSIRGLHKINDVADSSEPEMERLIYHKGQGGLRYLLYRWIPLMRKRSELQMALSETIKYYFVTLPFSIRLSAIDKAFDDCFSTEKLDSKLMTIRQGEAEKLLNEEKHSFPAKLPTSFLPPMIKVARENNIRLIFVRAPILNEIKAGKLDESECAYIGQLSDFLEKNNCSLFNIMERINIKEEHFKDLYHFNAKGKEMITKSLVTFLSKPRP